MGHTVLLINHRPVVRFVYKNFSQTEICIQGFVKSFQQFMMKKYSRVNYLEIHRFIDGIYDLKCLVYNKKTNHYGLFGKDWFKGQVNLHVIEKLNREQCMYNELGRSAVAMQKELERRLFEAKIKPADQKKKK